DAFLEVEVDGMVPAAAAVDVGPVLDLARLGDQLRDPVGVEGVRVLAVHLDGPREHRTLWAVRRALTRHGVARVAATGPAPSDGPRPHRRYDGDLLRQRLRHLALVVAAAAVGYGQHLPRCIDALHGAHHAELHDGADARVVGNPSQRLGQRHTTVG